MALPIEDRKLVPGLRVKLRIALKELGIKKFTVDIHRSGTLIVYLKTPGYPAITLNEFEGRRVMYVECFKK